MAVGEMAKRLIVLSEEIDQKLTRRITEHYGNKRGALSIIVEEALREFFAKN